MPWIAPIIATVDSLGYLYCTDCRPADSGEPVHGDQHFGADDKCERCGKQLEHVPTSGYVRA